MSSPDRAAPLEAPAPTPSDDRLESWKEVAAYLKRDVTTVRRWERKEGLPVHRHPHDKQGSVFAFKTELDAWRRTISASRSDPLRRPVAIAGSILLASIAVVVAGVAGWRAWRTSRVPDPVSGTVRQVTGEPGMELFPGLSPDGSWIVYAAGSDGNVDVFLRSLDSAKPTNLTADFAGRDTQPALSPDGGRIAFRSDRRGGGIFLKDLAGEGLSQVTDFGFNPAWAPDGRRLVFATEEVDYHPGNRSSVAQLWVVDTGTGVRSRLNVPDGVQPSWSPDGRRIAYWALPLIGNRRDIWTVDPDGGAPVRVTDDAAIDWCPVWSADSRYLYFVSDRAGSMNVWRVAIDSRTGRPGSLPERVTLPSSRVAHMTFSGDGRRLVWASVSSASNLHSVSIDPERMVVTAPEVAITTGSGRTEFGVSPDGQWMVFAKDDVLRVARLDGSGMHPVTGPSIRPRLPSWSPDGSHIVFQADYEGRSVIWTVAIDGSELKKAVEGTADVGAAVWDPHVARLAYADFSTEPARVRIRSLNTGADQVLPALDASRSFRPAAWSSDGERLAGFVRGAGGIVVYSFRDRTYDQLTGGRDSDPVWLPDGRHLLFTSDDQPGKLMIVDRIARTTRALEGMGADPVSGIQVAPGGGRVFFARVHEESDLWMLRRR